MLSLAVAASVAAVDLAQEPMAFLTLGLANWRSLLVSLNRRVREGDVYAVRLLCKKDAICDAIYKLNKKKNRIEAARAAFEPEQYERKIQECVRKMEEEEQRRAALKQEVNVYIGLTECEQKMEACSPDFDSLVNKFLRPNVIALPLHGEHVLPLLAEDDLRELTFSCEDVCALRESAQ